MPATQTMTDATTTPKSKTIAQKSGPSSDALTAKPKSMTKPKAETKPATDTKAKTEPKAETKPKVETTKAEAKPKETGEQLQQSETAEVQGSEVEDQTKLVKMTRDLGQVNSVDGLCKVVGGFLTATVPLVGSNAACDLKATLKIPNIIDLELALSLKVERGEAKIELEGGMRFTVAKVFDLYLASVKVGAFVGGKIAATADSGYEGLRMMLLAMMPSVEGLSSDLATAIYENPAAYKAAVLEKMQAKGSKDKKGNDTEDSIKTGLEYGVMAGVEVDEKAGIGASVDMEVGNRTQTTLTKGEDGKLEEEKKEGMFLSMKHAIGKVGWDIDVDAIDESAVLSGKMTAKLKEEQLNETVAKCAKNAGAITKFSVQQMSVLGMPLATRTAFSTIGQRVSSLNAANIKKYQTQTAEKVELGLKLKMLPKGKFKFTVHATRVARYDKKLMMGKGMEVGMGAELRTGHQLLSFGN